MELDKKIVELIIDEVILFHDTNNMISKKMKEDFINNILAKVSQIEPPVILPKPTELEPGQVWMGDADFPYQNSYTGEFAYILMSIEPNDRYWKVAQWQEWEYGAQQVEFTEKEIRLMKYIGHIKDFRLRSK